MRADLIKLKVQQHSSGTEFEYIAGSTSVSLDITAAALETTSQTDGLNATFEAGKVTATVSGEYLLASDGDQFTNLFTHMNNGHVIGVELYRGSTPTKFIDCDGVITSLNISGGLSDALATGSYTIQLSGNLAV